MLDGDVTDEVEANSIYPTGKCAINSKLSLRPSKFMKIIENLHTNSLKIIPIQCSRHIWDLKILGFIFSSCLRLIGLFNIPILYLLDFSRRIFFSFYCLGRLRLQFWLKGRVAPSRHFMQCNIA